MKKLIFLFVMVYISVDSYCQKETSDTLFDASGAIDTTVFRVFKRDMAYLEVDISTCHDGDTLDIGFSADKTWIGSLPGEITFPLTLDVSDFTKDVNGVYSKSRIAVKGNTWPAKYIAFTFHCGASGCKPSIHY